MSSPPSTPKPPAGPKPPPPPPSGPRPHRFTAEELYPVAEMAKLWHCSTGHIYNLIARGELQSVQLAAGGRAKNRIPASAAAEFIARHTRPKGRAA